MQEKTKLFQTGLIVICMAAAVLSVLVFSGKIPLGEKKDNAIAGNLVVWGTFPGNDVKTTFEGVGQTYEKIKVNYVQKDPRTYNDDIVQALASGTGPDLFFYTDSELYNHTPRLLPVPFTNYPDLTYRQTFIDQSSRNISSKGILGFPVTVDPLVLYYNQDLLSSAFQSAPPATWNELAAMTPALTKKTESGNIIQSAIALGGYRNVTHAKDILSLLMLQAGSSITARDPDGRVVSTLMFAGEGQSPPAPLALNFYTKFSMPEESVYTWNPSLPESRQQFLAGKLVFYIGYASELSDLKKRNPNLPVGVSLIPQRASSTTKSTYGTFTSLGISKLSKQQPAAVALALWITQPDVLEFFTGNVAQIPARKDLLGKKPKDDALGTLFYNSALISRGWIDPDAAKTDQYFGRAITGVVGRTIPNEFDAIRALAANIQALLAD